MNDMKYKKSESYVAQQLQVLNDKIKEQNAMIKNLRLELKEKQKTIMLLTNELKDSRLINKQLVSEPSDELS